MLLLHLPRYLLRYSRCVFFPLAIISVAECHLFPGEAQGKERFEGAPSHCYCFPPKQVSERRDLLPTPGGREVQVGVASRPNSRAGFDTCSGTEIRTHPHRPPRCLFFGLVRSWEGSPAMPLPKSAMCTSNFWDSSIPSGGHGPRSPG